MAALQFLLMIPALGNFLFTFGTGVELIRFISFRAVFLQLPAGAASPPHGTGVNPGKNGEIPKQDLRFGERLWAASKTFGGIYFIFIFLDELIQSPI